MVALQSVKLRKHLLTLLRLETLVSEFHDTVYPENPVQYEINGTLYFSASLPRKVSLYVL